LADAHLDTVNAPAAASIPFEDPFATVLSAEEERFARIRRECDILWP
jgi:hypothetical protein